MNIPQNVLEILEKNPNMGRERLAKITGISISDARIYNREFKGKIHHKNSMIQRGMVLFDIHYPEHNDGCIDIVYDFCKDFQPDYFILGGDQLHMDCISHYNEGKPKLLEGKRLNKEYDGFQKDIINRFNNILKTSCKRYFMIGNHEYRLERLLEAEPKLEGLVELERNLDLSKYKIIPFNEVLEIGKICIIHGIYYNKYHASKNVHEYNENIFSGHVHTNQIDTMNTPTTHEPRQGVSVGCLCNVNPEYKHNKPNNWVHQFMFFYLFEDGTFNYYLPIILNNRCMINNKLYVGGN